jgi:hypothetical protein
MSNATQELITAIRQVLSDRDVRGNISTGDMARLLTAIEAAEKQQSAVRYAPLPDLPTAYCCYLCPSPRPSFSSAAALDRHIAQTHREHT